MDHNNFESQWTMYATNSVSSKSNRSSLIAGGMLAATGAAVFSIPSNANASFMYVPEGKSIIWGTSSQKVLTLPLPNSSGVKFQGFSFSGQDGARAVGGKLLLTSKSNNVQKLSYGESIHAGSKVKSVTNPKPLLRLKNSKGTFGSFKTGKTYFAGFELKDGDLGYIELALTSTAADPTGGPNELTVIALAYDNGSITAGYVGPVPEASNTATALLLLACAGGSLTSWRRRKPVAA